MDIRLLDCILKRRLVNLVYIILRHMLSTLGVNNQLLPYGSIITKILQYFHVLLHESVYMETKRIGEEAITGIGFYRRNGEWVKMALSKT